MTRARQSRHERNADADVIKGFGEEWSTFDQARVDQQELQDIFDRYFSLFPWDRVGNQAEGFDLGCGSGRWAAFVAPRVRLLHCIDPSRETLDMAGRHLSGFDNCRLHLAGVDSLPLADSSMDFGYSLGVLHHVPDTQKGLRECAKKLKPGAPFLIYLYYALENRPWWYRWIWRAADLGRRRISRLSFKPKLLVTTVIAALIYWPASQLARIFGRFGPVGQRLPLAFYSDKSFYTMRTDAFDRFGTRIEQRFTAEQIEGMMRSAGIENISFRADAPYWCALGYKRTGKSSSVTWPSGR